MLAGADQVIRLPHNGALTAAAADGACGSRIGIDHHVRAGFYRRGTTGLVHEHERFGNITACSGFQQRQVDVLCGENAALGTAIGRAAAFRDQLCHDRNRDLLDGQCTNVQTDGRMNAVEICPREAFFLKHVQQTDRASFRPDHAEIARHGAAQKLPQAVRVITMPARDNGNVIALSDADFLDCRRKQITYNLLCFRKARMVGKRRSVVRYDNLKTEIGRIAAKRLRDRAAAEQDQAFLRHEIARVLYAVRVDGQRRRKSLARIFCGSLQLFQQSHRAAAPSA